MADAMSSPLRVANGADGVKVRRQGSDPAAIVYTNVRPCPCGRPIPIPPADQPGARPRLCGRCKQTRRALTFIRAGARILEQLRDPDYDPPGDR